jgi:hypothetical protein
MRFAAAAAPGDETLRSQGSGQAELGGPMEPTAGDSVRRYRVTPPSEAQRAR